MHALILADVGFGLIFGLLVMLAVFVAIGGFFAVFVAAAGFAFKMIGSILRTIFGGSRPYVEQRPRRKAQVRPIAGTGGGRKDCRNKRCGCSNPASAVYCARCGQRFYLASIRDS